MKRLRKILELVESRERHPSAAEAGGDVKAVFGTIKIVPFQNIAIDADRRAFRRLPGPC
jgi:hypothetical protein